MIEPAQPVSASWNPTRGELTDEEWELIADLMCDPPGIDVLSVARPSGTNATSSTRLSRCAVGSPPKAQAASVQALTHLLDRTRVHRPLPSYTCAVAARSRRLTKML